MIAVCPTKVIRIATINLSQLRWEYPTLTLTFETFKVPEKVFYDTY